MMQMIESSIIDMLMEDMKNTDCRDRDRFENLAIEYYREITV